MDRVNEIRNNSNIRNLQFITTELNAADNCSIKHNTLINKHRWILGPTFLFHQNIDVEIDGGIDRISQDLYFRSNITIIHYSKKTSTLSQQPEKQSHWSIIVNLEYYSSFSKIIRHIAWTVT